MIDEETRKMKDELDSLNALRRENEREIEKLQKSLVRAEEDLKAAEETIDTQHNRIKFLEGQVDAYQYCLNCRR